MGRLTVLVWVTAPSAVFLAAPYTEALFLACAFPAWLAARRQRWMAAGLLTALSCTVRVSGVFLAVAVVVHWLVTRRGAAVSADDGTSGRLASSGSASGDDQETSGPVTGMPMSHDLKARDVRLRTRWAGLGWILLPVVPLLAWSAYLQRRSGDWLAWLHAQSEGWNREFTAPWDAFARTWDAAFDGTMSPGFAWMFRAEIVAMIVGVMLSAALVWWRKWGEATWVGLQVIAFGTSTWYFSVPRATLLWWPLWVTIAMLAARRRWVLWAYLTVSVPLMAVWAVAFLTGRWAG